MYHPRTSMTPEPYTPPGCHSPLTTRLYRENMSPGSRDGTLKAPGLPLLMVRCSAARRSNAVRAGSRPRRAWDFREPRTSELKFGDPQLWIL